MACCRRRGCGPDPCSDQTGPTNDAPPAANASAPDPDVNASSAAAGLPAGAYRPYFEQNWPATGLPVTPAEVAAMIDSAGAQQAIGSLWGDDSPNRWETVARGIATGDPAWLEIAPRIAQGTDAGTSTMFGLAMQDALTTNAAGALRLMGRMGVDGSACTDGSIEPPPEQIQAFHAEAIASVEAVTDPVLEAIKSGCLTQLRSDSAAL